MFLARRTFERTFEAVRTMALAGLLRSDDLAESIRYGDDVEEKLRETLERDIAEWEEFHAHTN